MSHIKTLIAVAAMVAASAASAAPSTISFVSAAPSPQVYATVTFNGGVSTGQAALYEYIVDSTAPAGTFAAFCLEPFQHFTSPWTYDNAGTFTVAQSDALSKLFTGAHWQSWNYASDGVTTDAQRAGLGYAVWDIMLDGALNFSGGNFQVLNDGFGGSAVSFATTAYAAGNTSMVGNLIRMTDPIKQDIVIAVPEPGTYALMLAGLLSIGFVAGRRRNS